MKDSASLLMDYMMPYVGHGQVLDAVLALLFPRDAEPETRQKREECHARLAELGFIKWFLTAFDIKRMCNHVEFATKKRASAENHVIRAPRFCRRGIGFAAKDN